MTPRRALILLAFGLALGPAALATEASAQISNRQMSAPRPFGVMLGDVFTLTTRFDVAAPYRLDPAALPKPGPLTYWLDLRGLTIAESKTPGGGTRYEIKAEYQTFYAPLEAIEQTVPPFTIAAADPDGKRVEAKSASWTFLTSPLRPVVLTAGGGSAYALRPDAAPTRKSLRGVEIETALAAGAALLALVLLAWSRAWPPFSRRPSRPFARAARTVAKTAGSGEEGKRSAALALHRAFDAAAGRRLLGDDLGGFFSAHPAFAAHEEAIRSFFKASREAFFGGRSSLPAPDELTRFARRLAAAERAA
ncbi:MAG: hypothetical protein DI565_14245 [Ancylobacter novellus]|uniref:MxaA protein n=1 Tax=Ancylobacter novellus TaxID=921 RepID=A0A2W5KE60_ANCNO|nr:MAG: hypothetical protein DI565_14245 [Ancylobacter novellus]